MVTWRLVTDQVREHLRRASRLQVVVFTCVALTDYALKYMTQGG